MSTPIQIAQRAIGRAARPFIVAEMSANHNGSLDRALAIVEASARAGAHALKIQTYTAETMTLDLDEGEFRISDPNSPWSGTSLFDLYTDAHTPWDWHKTIFDRARELGLIPFSTPFDGSAVDLLEDLDTPCYKIASFENTDLALIRRVSSTGKPVLMSTGMATVDELDEAVGAAREAGCRDLILLKCTSTYPAGAEHTNLETIPHMRARYDCEVGLSDHTLGLGAAVGAVALGATVIEKHLTLSRDDGGVDSAFSMEPSELAQLVIETELAWKAVGSVNYGPTAPERASLQFRRSLYVVKDIKEGELIGPDNVRAIRPGLGLAPKALSQVVGRRAAVDIAKGTPLSWDIVR